MSAAAATLPARQPDLVLSPFDNDGNYVVKNRRTGKFVMVGAVEHFLLEQLDGERTAEQICTAFEAQFNEPLSLEELTDFLELATSRDLVVRPGKHDAAQTAGDAPVAATKRPRAVGGILMWRVRVFDPDRLFNWLEPKIRFVWTKGFLLVSGLAIVLSALVAWSNRGALVSTFSQGLRVETVVLVWVILVLATLLHEFAHGLTCKHYGGEVHEIGAMFMFFMPFFYCNVSDSWLFPQKSRRLWVTAAGSYCDLCIWAVSVFLWRLTIQDTLLNYLAWTILMTCGGRVFFNANPLLKLDGYYFLSDALDSPNLRRAGQDRWMCYVRWLLWGAERPQPEPGTRALLWYGGLRWVFKVPFLTIVFMGLFHWLSERWGVWGLALAGYAAWRLVLRRFRGFSNGEIRKMIKNRPTRTKIWLFGIVAAVLALCLIRLDDRAGGTFQVRPSKRVELRAPVAGFLREVSCEEGDHVSSGALVARIEVPDLASQIAQKHAERRQSQADLRKLEAGARPEQIIEQRQRVERAKQWVAAGKSDLQRAKAGLAEDLTRLDQQIAQCQAEFDFAKQALKQDQTLFDRGALAGQQFLEEKKHVQVVESQLQQAQAQRRAREASGTLEFEAELGRREKELADAKSSLSLLEAGSRPEEIDAERAHLARVQEELNYLESLQTKSVVAAPLSGLVTTPRMKEKVGQYLEKGALICLIEDTSSMEAEIALPEQDVAGVQPGQVVELKARALPFETFQAQVERVAPAAVEAPNAVQGTVTIYCHIGGSTGLQPGMTGFGRIHRSPLPLGMIVFNGGLRYLRTEFWW